MPPHRALGFLLAVLLAHSTPSRAQPIDDWGPLSQRFMEISRTRDFHAVERFAREVIARDPAAYQGHLWLALALDQLFAFDLARASFDRAVERFATAPEALRTPAAERSVRMFRTAVLLKLGEFAAALEDIERIEAIVPGNGNTWVDRAHALLKLGRLDEAAQASAQALSILGTRQPRSLDLLWDQAEIHRARGDVAAALASARALAELTPLGHCAVARIYAFPADPATRDLPRAQEALAKTVGTPAAGYAVVSRTGALIALEQGRPELAWPALENERIAWGLRLPFEDLAHARCALALGKRERAIERMVVACRRDRSLRSHFAEPAWAPIAAEVKATLADLDGAKTIGERAEVTRKLDVARLTLEQIRGFVRAFRFEAVQAELESFAARSSGSAQEEAKALARRLALYAALKRELLAQVAPGGKLHRSTLPLAAIADLAPLLVKADADGYELVVKSGTAKGKWSQLPMTARFELLAKLVTTGEQAVTLAELAWDTDDAELAERALAIAWRTESLRGKVQELVCRYRSVAKPAGGFDLHEGRFVTADEKRHLAQGEVLFRGAWVAKGDVEHLAKNHVKVDGKWVPLTAEQMRARGYHELDGAWMTAAELYRRRGEWSHAWEEKTAHYLVRSNHSEHFAKRLAVAAESAHASLTKLFGAAPKADRPMRLYAFRTYEDYRSYCEKTNNLGQINAAGFSPSEPETACGYDKLKDEGTLLGTMVHEATHLFFSLAFPGQPPSWLAEGMATYFEGFNADASGSLTFHHRPPMRAAQFRLALAEKRVFKLEEMMSSNAGVLINSSAEKALVFYAQCWAFFYYLQQADVAQKGKFDAFIAAIAKGEKATLAKALGVELAALDQAFIEYMKGQ